MSALEAPRALRKPGDTDAVTFSWADADAGPATGSRASPPAIGADGEASASALAVAFAGREPLGAIAEAGAQPPAGADRGDRGAARALDAARAAAS